MHYTKEERCGIAEQIIKKEMSTTAMAAKLGLPRSTISAWVKNYRDGKYEGVTSVPLKDGENGKKANPKRKTPDIDLEAYQTMTKEELINELIRAKANELRAKKGYEVKGDGADKEFISLRNRNSRS